MKNIKILVLLILLLCGCTNKSIEEQPKDVFIILNDEDIDVYDEIYVSDLIIDSNVLIEDYKINTNELGTKNIEFYYKYNNKKYIYKTSINIVDNEKPKIFGGSSKTVAKGYEGDLCNLVMYADNFDNKPLCTIQGDYNLDVSGSYQINIVVSDSSGNQNNHNIKLNVVDKINNNNNYSNNNKYSFADAYKDYKTDNLELGIDVSEWQGSVDYERIKNAGATFVMIRIGYSPKDGEEPNIDGQFLNNIKNAKEAGLKVGVYLYSKALSKESAIKEVKWIIKTLNNEKLDLPIVFDWEIWSNWNSYNLSFHSLNEISKTFIKEVEKNGYKGALYGSKFYLENFWDNTYNNVWLAHYTSKTSYEGKYYMWQFSNVGKIDGINGDVDMNILYNLP